MLDTIKTQSIVVNDMEKLQEIIDNYNINLKKLQDVDFKIDIRTKSINLEEEIGVILINSSKVMRDNAKHHFEKIVTDALQFISQDNTYKFIIKESQQRGKPAYEFYIETLVNGHVSEQKPEEACGGGFVDIISVTLKVAYLVIFQSPKIMNLTLLLDEPGKMISEQMSIKFAEYVKFLGKQFGLNITMITHSDNLANIADQTFVVEKNSNGISQVNTLANIQSSYVVKDVQSILEKKGESDEPGKDIQD